MKTRELLTTLSGYWMLALFFALLINWQIAWDKNHPPPSQAVVDEVYRQNNEDRIRAINTFTSIAAGMVDAASAFQTNAPSK